jgi:hypothetical protein
MAVGGEPMAHSALVHDSHGFDGRGNRDSAGRIEMMDGRMRVVWYSLIVGTLTLGSTFCLNCRGPNPPPGKPDAPNGPSSGFTDSLYAFTSDAWDPDGDRICCRFDWGDGDTSDWTGWTWSGHLETASHSWQAGGTFTVKAQAKDSGGAVSAWSDGRQIKILALSWAKTFGGTGSEDAFSVRQTSDGGYIVAGTTSSYGEGNGDVWLIKTDASGNKTWDKTFGGTGGDGGSLVRQTSDGGYIVTGYTISYGAGNGDVWLIKTDESGNKTWDRTFGGTASDNGSSVQQTADGGYIITGSTQSYGTGSSDVWLVKTDATGNKIWDKAFGGTGDDVGVSVQQTSDGGYIVAGCTPSFGAGNNDAWLIKTDSSGNKIWDETYGGEYYDFGHSVQQTPDGGYIVTGYTGYYGEDSSGLWLIKTDATGNKTWDKTYGGDEGHSIHQTTDGGYIIMASNQSYGAGVSDVWLVKTDASGNRTWDKTFGGTGWDLGQSVQQTADGGYILAGSTMSYGAGESDVWLIRIDADGR